MPESGKIITLYKNKNASPLITKTVKHKNKYSKKKQFNKLTYKYKKL